MSLSIQQMYPWFLVYIRQWGGQHELAKYHLLYVTLQTDPQFHIYVHYTVKRFILLNQRKDYIILVIWYQFGKDWGWPLGCKKWLQIDPMYLLKVHLEKKTFVKKKTKSCWHRWIIIFISVDDLYIYLLLRNMKLLFLGIKFGSPSFHLSVVLLQSKWSWAFVSSAEIFSQILSVVILTIVLDDGATSTAKWVFTESRWWTTWFVELSTPSISSAWDWE